VTSKKPSKASERVKAMQAQQAAAARRRRAVAIGVIVVMVIAAVVGVGIVVQSNRDEVAGTSVAPAGVTADNGVLRGQSDAPVDVVVYEDFQCPICKAFEDNVESTMTSYIDDGTVRLEYRPIAFLDEASSTDYSSRALATAACAVDDGGPKVFARLHDLLFANQPKEGTAGLDDATLAKLAGQAGADEAAVAACQSKGTYDGWVKDVTDQASQDGIEGTPTYFVDGSKVAFTQDEEPKATLTRLIDQAASAQ
jgi:protein-disulfide isomerase